MTDTQVNKEEFVDTNIFRSMSYGVYVVGTMDNERPTGCIANSIMQITSSPATIAISINHDNYTNGCIEKTGKFAFSILSQESDPSLIGNFGFQSGKEVDKFKDIPYELAEGVPVVKGSCGYVVCNVIQKMETATHTVFLGEVLDGNVYGSNSEAMTYAYYHKVVKGRSPKNAPTYLPEEDEQKTEAKATKYVCQICGYIHEGETLPPDFICPTCKNGADKFKKLEQ